MILGCYKTKLFNVQLRKDYLAPRPLLENDLKPENHPNNKHKSRTYYDRVVSGLSFIRISCSQIEQFAELILYINHINNFSVSCPVNVKW